MEKVNPTSLVLADGVGDRLRIARTDLSLKQCELSDLGKVSRATQISYESGNTEPNTAYLRRIQPSGIDMRFVLLGRTGEVPQVCGIAWHTLQQAHEDVELFCLKNAPECPQKYRWQMVAKLYEVLHTSSSLPSSGGVEPMALIASYWDALGQA